MVSLREAQQSQVGHYLLVLRDANANYLQKGIGSVEALQDFVLNETNIRAAWD